MPTRVHRPLKVLSFNANCIWRQLYELSNQLQDRHIDVALHSETHMKPHERFSSQIFMFTEPTAIRVQNAELPLQLAEASPTTTETSLP
jgi:hypothetical protein